jgi:apolipoprotein N-acyltransferase
MLTMILLVFALVLFCIAAFVNPVEPWRGKLCCIAFACWVASELVKGIPQLGR